MFQIDKKNDDGFYVLGWGILAGIFLLGILEKLLDFNPLRLLGPCMLHLLTGYYCPGCGGTRAVFSLLEAKPLQSFAYHPIVLYTAVIGGWFMISQTIERISGGRIRIGMHFREIYLWIALGLIAVNFLLKNMALMFWDVDLMALIRAYS